MCKAGDNLLKAAAIGGGAYFGAPYLLEALGAAGGATLGGGAAAAGADAATAAAWGSGAGLGADTLSAMGYGGATAAGAAAPYVSALAPGAADFAFMAPQSSLSTLTTSQLGELSANLTAADVASGAARGATLAQPGGGGGGGAPGAEAFPVTAGGGISATPLPQSMTSPFVGEFTFPETITPSAGAPATASPIGGAPPLGDAGIAAGGAGGAEAVPTGLPEGATAAPAAGGADPLAPPPGFNVPPLGGAAAAPASATPSAVQRAIDLVSNNPFQAANLGLIAASMAKQHQAGSGAQQQLRDIAGPTSAVETQLLDSFSKGQISGADQFAVNQFVQKQTAAVDQYYAKAGLSNSSMHTAAKREIQKQAEGMRQQALQNMLNGGLKAAGVTNPLLTAGVTAGLQSDNAAMAAMQNFLQTMARINTPQAQQAPSQPATTGAPS